MKKIFVGAVLFFVVLGLVGCQKKEGTISKSEVYENIKKDFRMFDQKGLNGYQFRFKEISEEDYKNVPRLELYDKETYYQKYMDINFVPEKIKSGIALSLNNGKKKEFVIDEEENNFSKSYDFLGKYKDFPFYLVYYSGDCECSETILVNQKDGETISFMSFVEPYILQDKKSLFFIENEFFDNGSHLSLVTNYEKKFSKEFQYPLGIGIPTKQIKFYENKFFVKYDVNKELGSDSLDLNIKSVFIEISFEKREQHSIPPEILRVAFLKSNLFFGCIISEEDEDGGYVKLDDDCISSKTEEIIKRYGMEDFPEETLLMKKIIKEMSIKLNSIFPEYNREDYENKIEHDF